MAGEPFRRLKAGGFAVHLPADVRRELSELGGQLLQLVSELDPSDDPAVARLYPPAYPDDPLQNLDYERVAYDGLRDGRIEAARTLQRTAKAKRLTEEELLAWMGSANDLRLVLGTRLGVTEGSEPADFAEDPAAAETFEIYLFLGGVVDAIVRAVENQ